ncbi:MAG: biotin--[acetyl-CoA-carboxylase] ligase [Deltaproteobacteria bacterium]|nr:biotin--[acetyl-CoA-carboxylase] ligase [Deltaproteobacteria bacterium]
MSTHRADPKDLAILQQLLKPQGEFVSGEAIASEVGISRTAVGKRVAGFRGQGWTIEAVPNRGYRVDRWPDDLQPLRVRAALTTRRLGHEYLFVDQLDSTNSYLTRAAAEGAEDGTVVVAGKQTAGRGRLGRRWYSGKDNLCFSALFRPQLAPSAASTLTLASAVAVAETVEHYLQAQPLVKWPNDVLWRGRKLCGILLELGAEVERVLYVVVGIGLNVNARRFPAEIEGVATSLAQVAGRRFSRAEVLLTLLERLEHWVDRNLSEGAKPVIERWLDFAPWIGEQVTVRQGAEQVSVKALGLTPSGGLQIRRADGSIGELLAGDLLLKERP